jgi:hypothetical protein
MLKNLLVATATLTIFGTEFAMAQKKKLPPGYEVIYCPHGGKGPFITLERGNSTIYQSPLYMNSLEDEGFKHIFFHSYAGINTSQSPSFNYGSIYYLPSVTTDLECDSFAAASARGVVSSLNQRVKKQKPKNKVCEAVGGFHSGDFNAPIVLMPKGKEARFVCWNASVGEQPSKDTVVLDPKNPDPKQVEELLNSRQLSSTARAILEVVEGDLGELETPIESAPAEASQEVGE